MLVTFHTDAHADILMFGDIAIQLLKMMGHSGTVPGALVADEVPAALERLQKAIATQPTTAPEPVKQNDDREDDQDSEPEVPVTLAHRALPLIELLAAAAAAHCDVMWDS
ncbi:MAG: DUF1840 domain-containing protein [Candidatus Competibacteraceae bacterium]|nr:DUF1840 domain-containing protein [Candidatus Competibacteraceae bacterium]